MRSFQLTLPAAVFCIWNSMNAIAVTAPNPQHVQFYFDPDTQRNALQAIDNLEQKKQALTMLENRLDVKLKTLDEKLAPLEKREPADQTAIISPKQQTPAPWQIRPFKPWAKKQAGKTKSKVSEKFPVTVGYGDSAVKLKTKDGKFAMRFQNRLQLRYANPFDRDPRSITDLERTKSSFMLRRARIKVGGHAYWSWLQYYMQYDWSQPVLRDLYLGINKFPWAQFRFGRGKVLWNDERVTSSGEQQFANRSIVNDIFTVDRQQGVQLFGRVFPGKWYDFSYSAGVFSGLGVGERNTNDSNLMFAGRLQWNFLGEELAFSQSDLEFREKPAISLAFAAATNRSKCTAFETDKDSCRALPGFAVGEAGQFRVNQAMQEFRFKWRGFSLQNEAHWKQVIDTLKAKADPTRKTDLLGAYIQAGYFPHSLMEAVPRQLELAVRYALVDLDVARSNNLQREVSAAINWFFNGHANKLTFEISHLKVEDPVRFIAQSKERVRLQWDVSF
jgi:phosphate-selective porin OprO and OprP